MYMPYVIEMYDCITKVWWSFFLKERTSALIFLSLLVEFLSMKFTLQADGGKQLSHSF